MQMIGKLGKDKKANWPEHLAEIEQAYTSTWCTVFGYRPRLPIDFYFPTFRSTEVPLRGASAKCVDEYVATVHDQLRPSQQQKSNDKNGPMTKS